MKNTYDELNRLIQRDITKWNGVEWVTQEKYEYNDLGNLVKLLDDSLYWNSLYDELWRLTSEDQNGKIVSYDYDLNNNSLNSTYPSGRKIGRSYDELWRLTGIKDGENNVATYSYDWLEQISQINWNNTKINYTYDGFG